MVMSDLPLPDPGRPDLRSPAAYLLWLARRQWRPLALGTTWGILWMVAMAAVPAAIGAGVQAAADGDEAGVVRATVVLVVLGVVQAAGGVLRHRMAVTNWITAASRTQQLVVRHAAYLGATLRRTIATGEVVAVTSNDVEKIGSGFDVFSRFMGSVVGFVAVLVVLLRSAPLLGALVLVIVPLLALAVGPLLRPLERRESAQRHLVGRASELASDTVAGLRVLRGIGGEELFLRRFHEASQRVRSAAVDVAKVRSLLEAQQVALPGLFLVLVTWVGARLVQNGTLEVGQLVAFYGYSAFLMTPLRTFTEAAQRWTRSYVGAARVVRVLRLERDDADAPAGGSAIAPLAVLHDPTSELTVEPGVLTAVVCAEQSVADAIALRLAGIGPGGRDVTLDGVPLARIPRAQARAAVLVQDKDPVLLSGTLADLVDVPRSGRVTVSDAVRTASAYDVLDALVDSSPEVSDPLAARITERGRSLSGGQRQRLALARSLVADPPVLVLDEPTSAVDSHTEARIASALHEARAGRTTVVLTSSPLVLDRADRVALVLDGRVVATGRHRELLRDDPAYRAVVTREVAEAGEPGAAADHAAGGPREEVTSS
ncbi:MAG: ATP-binding cassette domain-containing protein [Frankiales bacterium]|nr:ATP-binding cassette domain-containing protein [Frankiales bacterium]